ncbi:MAG: tRNA (guanosine(37)-N1)-methyltransferase TrmD [Elusimicrobiota bacterium]|nr:tRNA (guanosine(37)-N1)-methyltransferase TrmD [Endomicrobiia bacterium]MDW8055603.1 tRNA (guanosine(37)-N1)-methyltransferase TrmD [Elusimicrobiota bacterium]
MRIDIITIFPTMFDGMLSCGVISRAIKDGKIMVKIWNLREFAFDKHKTVDDKPYGGGAGMVLKPEPLIRAIRKIKTEHKRDENSPFVIYLSPQGKILNQKKVLELYKKKWLVLICGRYEGIDERVMKFVNEEISIGEYVLTGGEVAAMVVIDAVCRYVKGVVKEKESLLKESFMTKFLDYPQYTRPQVYMNMKVPEVLLSGDHKKIQLYRLKEAIRNTYKKRPDILHNIRLSKLEKKFLEEVITEENRRRK